MRLPLMTIRRWMIIVAIVALVCATAIALIERSGRSDPSWRIDPFSTDPPPLSQSEPWFGEASNFEGTTEPITSDRTRWSEDPGRPPATPVSPSSPTSLRSARIG
jgi:hypothetical protein